MTSIQTETPLLTSEGGQLLKLPCNSCGFVKHEILLLKKTDGIIQSGTVYLQEFIVAECRGCESISLWVRDIERKHIEPGSKDFAVDEVVSEAWHPPRVLRPMPGWINELEPFLQGMYKEIYGALHTGALRLAAMGARALLEHVMISQVGDRGGFSEKLKKLVDAGVITDRQKEYLRNALEVGHAAIHRFHTPSVDDIRALFDIVDAIVNIICVVGVRSKTLETTTPASPRKKVEPA